MNFVFVRKYFYLWVIHYICTCISRIENQWLRADKWIIFVTFATVY